MFTDEVLGALEHLEEVVKEHHCCSCERVDVNGAPEQCEVLIKAKRDLAHACSNAVGLYSCAGSFDGRVLIHGPHGYACEQVSGWWWVWRQYLDDREPFAKLPPEDMAGAVLLVTEGGAP